MVFLKRSATRRLCVKVLLVPNRGDGLSMIGKKLRVPGRTESLRLLSVDAFQR